ncbi:hypothetical protein L7I36_21235, partial [Obesumbacterium proteus]|uniref:hypothetical protein n=1 Tax=Obesumbacterium proteus TaxID=82983 RepID=UPI001EDB0066
MIKFTCVFYHVKNPTLATIRKQCFVFYFLFFDCRPHNSSCGLLMIQSCAQPPFLAFSIIARIFAMLAALMLV